VAPLPRRQYSPRVVLEALTTYNLGRTIEETRRHITSRFHKAVPVSTLHSWLNQFASICTFHRIRRRFSLSEDEAILARTFEHQQEYKFRLHRLKLNLLAKRLFPQVRRYLWFIADNCPNDLFQGKGARCSDGNLPELDLELISRDTNAVPLARLGLVLARNRRGRHEAIQRFMLANDSATVAVEVPVYLYRHEAPDLKLDGVLTGHIDVLQIRGRQIWILDYKPDARLETRAKFQLYLYARALSVRTGIPMRRIGLAYFDDHDYLEVAPNRAARNLRRQRWQHSGAERPARLAVDHDSEVGVMVGQAEDVLP
jgi:hypothetical protein